MTSEQYLSTQEVADILGVNRRTVVRLCNERKIRHFKPTPQRILIAKPWLDEYMQNQTIEPIIEKENENNE